MLFVTRLQLQWSKGTLLSLSFSVILIIPIKTGKNSYFIYYEFILSRHTRIKLPPQVINRTNCFIIGPGLSRDVDIRNQVVSLLIEIMDLNLNLPIIFDGVRAINCSCYLYIAGWNRSIYWVHSTRSIVHNNQKRPSNSECEWIGSSRESRKSFELISIY